MARSMASSGVGRKGDPARGGESTLISVFVVRFDEGVLFDLSGTGISTLAATLRVAMGNDIELATAR